MTMLYETSSTLKAKQNRDLSVPTNANTDHKNINKDKSKEPSTSIQEARPKRSLLKGTLCIFHTLLKTLHSVWGTHSTNISYNADDPKDMGLAVGDTLSILTYLKQGHNT